MTERAAGEPVEGVHIMTMDEDVVRIVDALFPEMAERNTRGLSAEDWANGSWLLFERGCLRLVDDATRLDTHMLATEFARGRPVMNIDVVEPLTLKHEDDILVDHIFGPAKPHKLVRLPSFNEMRHRENLRLVHARNLLPHAVDEWLTAGGAALVTPCNGHRLPHLTFLFHFEQERLSHQLPQHWFRKARVTRDSMLRIAHGVHIPLPVWTI
jgi:hypothetical protein